MARKMLINALHPEEARVAIVEEGQLVELDIEIAGREQTRGNIYNGVVVRVEPGLQAAFVDIGAKKLGFLQMGEIHPDFWQWREDVPEESRSRRPRIQEILRRGQELVVQVEKGERDMKGAALTTYISLPGRYMVVMPGSDSTGISRKVEGEADRRKLKEVAAELEIPEGIGYIIRTEALGKKKTELAKDLEYLVKLYRTIMEKAKETKGPALIYQESDIVTRTIRDYFTSDIDEVLVDSKEVYKSARAFFKQTMPKYEKLVKLHQEKRPILSRYQIEEQIDLTHEKKVPLKSGGSLVIEPTEALVSIDVNSGKTTGEKGVEETAFKTNVEAAAEAARQLRLRDLGGLIVIDFIDMRDKKHISEVEKTLKNALKADKARVTVGKISQFGMLEMSRQRIRQTLSEGTYLGCPHCEGRGKIKSVEAMALSFLRKVHAAAAKGTIAEVRGGLPLEVAYYLLNRKKRELAQIEDDYDIQVTVKGKPSFLMNQLEVELIKREKGEEPHPQPVSLPEKPAKRTPVKEELPEFEEEAPEELSLVDEEEEAEGEEKGEGKKRRRRRRKKKENGVPAEEAAAAFEAEEPAADEVEDIEEAEEAEEVSAAEAAEGKTRKRRRRRRKKKGAAEVTGAEAVLPTAAAETAAEEGAPLSTEEEGGEEAEAPAEAAGTATEGDKKRKRRRRKKPARQEGAAEPAEEAAPAEEQPREPELAASAAAVEEAPPAKPRRSPRKKKEAPPATATEEVSAPVAEIPAGVETATAAGVTEAAPAAERPKRTRKKKEEAAAAPEAEQPAKPERKRAPRRKKPEQGEEPTA